MSYLSSERLGSSRGQAFAELPRGAAAVWLALRRDTDVSQQALQLLQAQSRLATPALRQFARDLAFWFARSARRREVDLQSQFVERRRTTDLGVLQYRVGELIDALLRDDQARASLTVAQLREVAIGALRKLAEAELARRRFPSH